MQPLVKIKKHVKCIPLTIAMPIFYAFKSHPSETLVDNRKRVYCQE